MTAPRRIAVLGAPGTGKTTLVCELAARLVAHPIVVTEGNAPGDATLLMGLDLPCARADAQREEADARLRAQLQAAQVRYHVVYGTGPQRLQAALVALEAAGVLPAGTAPRRPEEATRAWAWVCEKCSDPACEHRLFSQLQERRG